MKFDLEPETCLRVSSSVYSRAFGQELVLLDFARGEYFALDEVGAEIWSRLSRGEPLAAIANQIASAYEVSEDRALADIYVIVTEMCARSLVERVSSSAALVGNLSRSSL